MNTLYISREEIVQFERSIEELKKHIPSIVGSLREFIDLHENNEYYIECRGSFLGCCRQTIGSSVTIADIEEMIVQYVITKDILDAIFGGSKFHRNNDIARNLEKLIDSFMTRQIRSSYFKDIDCEYKIIVSIASKLKGHRDKQRFLKMIYAEFYKAYNIKTQDRLGIVYTPNEIVDFMIRSTDYLLKKHFGKILQDRQVKIVDPCTGTGTFIASILQHIPSKYLRYKYEEEIVANELSILSYYVARLNIEYTYYEKMGNYLGFENIVFGDTLETNCIGKQQDAFAITKENTKRLKGQDDRKISVIIGNPPYNANQRNYNDQNSNREYDFIDKRVKDTFVSHSKAQKSKVYDMYSRFIRWSMDRVEGDGIVAFITNNSFIDSKSFDGFRKCVEEEFDHIYIIDLKGNIRADAKRQSKGNVFGIMVGVCIFFMVKSKINKKTKATINYYCPTTTIAEEKLQWLYNVSLESIPFEKIKPDKYHNWIDITDNDFEELVSAISKEVKRNRSEEAIFKLFSGGICTCRDEWMYDWNIDSLEKKVKYFLEVYNSKRERYFDSYDKHRYSYSKDRSAFLQYLGTTIKFSRELIERDFLNNKVIEYAPAKRIKSLYRPYTLKYLYFESGSKVIHESYRNRLLFGKHGNLDNKIICFSGIASNRDFHCLASKYPVELGFVPPAQCIPLYVYDIDVSKKHSNITHWGLRKFRDYYKDYSIDAVNIFHYTYAILHDPKYREKYAIDLKRHFPRLPFKDDFWKWAFWGKKLMAFHVDFEDSEPYELQRRESSFIGHQAKPKLKSYSEEGTIIIDEGTYLVDVPREAWNYRLGNRSAIDWVLNQYKEKKIRYATIRDKFNTYRFRDYKEEAILLLKKIVKISVETVAILSFMNKNQ